MNDIPYLAQRKPLRTSRTRGATTALLLGLLIVFLGLSFGVARAQTGPGQPTQLSVIHRSGQTFITWREIPNEPAATYRVYRHIAPINAGNLPQAQFLMRCRRPAAGSMPIVTSSRLPASARAMSTRW